MTNPTFRPRTILIVEDHLPDLKLARRAISRKFPGFTVRTALNGREALEDLRANGNPDLILLDLMMPIMDGWEFLEELRKDPVACRIPVVAVTTSENQKDIDRFYERFGNAYTVKPINPDTFESTIAAHGEFWTEKVRLPSG